MYQPSYSTSPPYGPSTSGASPPGVDPYRAAPISLPAKQLYQAAPPPSGGGSAGYISPPPPNGFSPMPTAAGGVGPPGGRYQLYSSQPSRPSSSRPYVQNGGASPAYTPGGMMPQQTPQQRHKGTLAPGQIVKVGDVSVRIERYLSEGGFAHVYLTTSDKPVYPPLPKGSEEKKGRWGEKGYTQHCLKRIAFEDEKVWVDVKKEIQVMKSLPPNPHLTQFLGSAHARLPNGGYEVFILMEFCPGGGIIDLLNKRLRDRLKEIEILNIFTDVCEGVAAMHALKQPLLHRDLKIENVLSGPSPYSPSPARPSPLIFKLCDFGSTTFPSSHPPQSKIEAEALAMDLNKNTTLQYRSPEMVEPMLGWAVGLPSDVWALGVLLYKLCYYTTPFEEHGTLAIVNAKYTFPQYPVYSPRIQHLIASMLVDHPARRPTVFEVLKIAHEMQGTKPEIDYPTPSRSFTSTSPAQSKAAPPPSSGNLLDFTASSPPPMDAATMQPSLVSSIQPQRRGRPTRDSATHQSGPTPPTPQPPSVPTPASVSIPSLPPAPKLQVTGDRATAPAGSEQKQSDQQKKPSLDAFGLPSQPSKQGSAGSGFGDSFGTSSSSGGVSSMANKFGGPSFQPSSKFGESFSSASGPSVRPTKTTNSPSTTATPHFPVTFGNDTAKPTFPIRRPSNSAPDGEISFETRFPSIEALSSPTIEISPTPNLISPDESSPVTRPQMQAKASMMGHLTGDTASPHKTTFSRPNEIPQPRSTQVTGTAFKGIQGGMLSPKPAQPKAEYFDGFAPLAGDDAGTIAPAQAAKAAKGLPEDLMSGDDGEDNSNLTVPLMGPSGQGAASSPASEAQKLPQSAQISPSTGHSRPLLPPLKAPKPSSNINDTQWSPLQRLQSGSSATARSAAGPTSASTDPNSSDDEPGPESASGGQFRRPSPNRQNSRTSRSPAMAKRMSTFESSSQSGPNMAGLSPTKRNLSPTKLSKSTSTPEHQAPNSDNRPSWARASSSEVDVSIEKNRPQSMYVATGSSASMRPTETSSPPKSAATERPSHDRKGSIGDMVSRFESTNLNTHAETSGRRGSGDASKSSVEGTISSPVEIGASVANPPAKGTAAASKKPVVATKPAALRRQSTLEQPASTAEPTVARAKPTSPVKPASLSSSSAAGNTGPSVSGAKPTNRPPIQKKPSIKHGDMPTVAGYSKSSSGRSFPISRAAPPSDTAAASSNSKPAAVKADGEAEKKEAGSRSGSPEKPQSVNSLIARWNKGEVGAKDAPVKRGGYI